MLTEILHLLQQHFYFMEKNWDEIALLFLIDSRIKISHCRGPELTVCRGFIFDKVNIKIHISKKTKKVTRGCRMVWERKWRKSFLMSSTVTKSQHLRDFRVMCFTVFFKSLGKQQKKYCSALQDLKNVEKNVHFDLVFTSFSLPSYCRGTSLWVYSGTNMRLWLRKVIWIHLLECGC